MLAVVVLAVGCTVVDSSQVSPDTVYMNWSGQYDEDQGRMHWKATYSVGGSDGTYLELTGQSDSRVNGQSMVVDHDSIFNTVDYEWSRVFPNPTAPEGTYTITYVDTEGNGYVNSVEMPPRPVIDPQQNQTVSLSAASYFVNWETALDVGISDSIEATLSMSDVTVIADDYDPVGASGGLRFTRDQLSQLRPGTARLQVCIRRAVRLEETPPSGADASVSYCSGSIGVRVDF
jgi:hypothetical protein